MLKTEIKNVKVFFEGRKKSEINKDRKEILLVIASKIAYVIENETKVNLNFICTHNSRISQIAQTWGFYAAHYFKLPIECFSGGTETTSFHRNSVKTLKDVGFDFNVLEYNHQNPVYEVYEPKIKKKFVAFSKTYDHEINKIPFIAITTCNNADENCPFIPEATYRFHLPYKDPKQSDNTPNQEEEYLFKNKKIANETYFLFSAIKSKLDR